MRDCARGRLVRCRCSWWPGGGFVLVGETVGVELLSSAGVFVPDLKGNSSRACDCLSADRVCSPASSICVSNWNVEFARCDRVCLLVFSSFRLRVSSFLASFSKV